MGIPVGIDPVWYAQSKLRRRQYAECIAICTELLQVNPYDQAVWYLKTRALTLENWIDDTEEDEEGIAEVLMDDNAVASVARPGTSFARPLTGTKGGMSPAVRPATGSGRPLTGFARPGTSARGGTSAGVAGAFQGGRPGTSRPLTSAGRAIRLGTASMAADPSAAGHIAVERLDFAKYAARRQLARVLCDYLLQAGRNPRRALELCAHATKEAGFKDWWWKARLGQCYYQLGLLRDAEGQLQSSLKHQDVPATTLQLCKVYARMDQPLTALEAFRKASERHPGDPVLLLGAARIHDALNDLDKGSELYKKVLVLDASNVEARACLAANHFYSDQPEIALHYFRHLLQAGVQQAELWNNLGLACWHASQWDMALPCFDKALAAADDAVSADIWYNIGHVAVGTGDLELARQAFRVALALDSGHAEAATNLGVLAARKGNDEEALRYYRQAQRAAEYLWEPWFNGALASLRAGNIEEAHAQAAKADTAFPGHPDTQQLLAQLKEELLRYW